jgi:phage shock protein A
MPSIFPKKKSTKIDKDQSFLDLKDAQKKIELSIKKKEQVAVSLKQKAVVAIQQKNEKLAKIHLAKKMKIEKDVANLSNIQSKLGDQMDAIEQAETIQIATNALGKAVSVLNQYAKIIENLNVEEIIATSEESMAVIEDASDALGQNDTDILDEEQVSEELESLQAEVALDVGNQLALTPEEGEVAPTEVAEQPPADSEQVKQELEKLRKELDMA